MKARRALRPINRILLDRWIAKQGQKISGLVLNVGAGEDDNLYGDKIVRVDAFAPHPTVRADLVHPLPFSDSVFDGAICTEVLEHVPDLRLVLRELARVLRPGAPLVVTIPFVFHYHPDPEDFLRLTPTGLRVELIRAGFEIELLSGVGGKLLTLLLLLESLNPAFKVFVRLFGWVIRPALFGARIRNGVWSDWALHAMAVARKRCDANN